MNGIINIYKEKGYTSFDVVAILRKKLWIKKIGHTGTLDPDAEGVLPVCIGKATKVVDLITDKTKRYKAIVKLGITTTTEDASGEVIETRDVVFDEDKIKEAAMSFKGEYDQTPPMYSALKVNGKKLYEYAREGKVIERKSRLVNIIDIEITKFLPPDRFEIDVKCSKGTYIRTLCVDIGEKLGCGAHMEYLLRTEVGSFKLEDALKLDEVEKLVKAEKVEDHLVKVDEVFDYEKLVVPKELNKYLYNGNKIITDKEIGTKYKVYDFEDKFIGVYIVVQEDKIYLRPQKMFI